MDFRKLHSNLRRLVVGVDTKIPLSNGKYVTAVNFDNAASTPPFYAVIKKIVDFAPWYSSVHRGVGYKSIVSTNFFEEGRDIIRDFVKADRVKDCLIYTKNTTESINALSYILCEGDREKVVLSTTMEHHANDLPWRDKFIVDYVNTDELGRLCLNDLESKLNKYSGRLKLVAVTGASNVTGYINPIHEIAKMVHQHDVKLLVDGAQLVPHIPIDMRPHGSLEHIDYLAFSAHKMYAPFGGGVLIGPKETFEKGLPAYTGGGCVRLVTHDFVQWVEPPAKDEAGTPNVMSIVALVAAIKTLKSTGMKLIQDYEYALANYAINRLRQVADIEIYTSKQMDSKRLGIIPFNIKGIHHNIVAKVLSGEDGIAVRNGMFCAHPYVLRLLKLTKDDIDYYAKNSGVPFPGMVRISFGLYNNYEEIERLVYALNKISINKDYYVNKYLHFH